ncbi:hypothetical protein [Halalkalicoccus salilacus]|uniref:hypothetical protein n=1 Tax=Halalkalicoccus salilacus TaxID=3117459 RepID=UPI00300F6695
MGFKYFKKTVTDGELYFGPAAGYEDMDPHEGQVSDPVRAQEQATPVESMKLVGGQEIDIHAGLEGTRQTSKQQYFLSCWRLGTDEEEGHWEKFAPGPRDVAIESTVGQLRWGLFPKNNRPLSVGKVRYINPRIDPTPTLPPETFFFKAEGFNDYTFTDENEFRIALSGGGNPLIDIRKDSAEDERFSIPDYPVKLFAALDVETVINRVIVTPNADDVEKLREDVRAILPDRADIPVEVSPLQAESEHCPSHAVYGWQNPTASCFPQIAQKLFIERREEEVRRTDWSKYQVMDWIQVVPVWAKDSLQGRAKTSHFEVFRYEENESLPDITAYSHEHLMYARCAIRYVNGEEDDRWKRWNTDDVNPVETARTPVTVKEKR